MPNHGGHSNAPHLVGETASSDRSSRLLQTGFDQEFSFIEMIRNGPENFRAKREILQVGASTWVVLDRFQNDVQQETETLWTFYPDLDQFRQFVLKAIRILSLVAFPVLWGISSIANEMVLLLLGEKWETAILPLQLLALMMPFRMIANFLPSATMHWADRI